MATTIETFAKEYKLRLKTDIDGTPIIVGKLGHIYEHSYSGTNLGLLFMPETPRAKLWGIVKAKGRKVGMVVMQDAESEGTILFDSACPLHAKLAISLVKVKSRRVMTEAQLAVLADARAKLISASIAPKPLVGTPLEGFAAVVSDEWRAAHGLLPPC
jgi:hypothetical protein